jgi:hypothetical protein
MAMKQGASPFLEYLGRDNRPRRTWLTNTDVHSVGAPFQNTDDPNWVVEDLIQHNQGTFEWLIYMNPDLSGNRSDWKVKIHCEYQPPATVGIPVVPSDAQAGPFSPGAGPTFSGQPIQSTPSKYIYPWFEHVRTDGSGGHKDTGMVFVAPDGTAWRADIMTVRSWPSAPMFWLNPLTLIPVKP